MEISNSGAGLLCTIRKLMPQQLRRVLKLTTLLLTIACIQVSARSYSQTVSFSGKDVPLSAVFTSIEKQTGLSFFFNYEIIKDAKPVSLDVKNVSLDRMLNLLLAGKGLDYYTIGKTVFITKKQPSVVGMAKFVDSTNHEKDLDIKGRVTNEQGEPLVGATVLVQNLKKGTFTDEKGMFELKNVPAGSTLELSYAGFQPKSIAVDGSEMIRVVMTTANNLLDEAQIIAYGNTTQRLSTGNINTVKSAEIEQQPVSNPLEAIEGRVPGLFITQSTGLPGSGVTVRVQGQNSLTKGNDPLYVINGVPYTPQLLPTINSILGTSGGVIINGVATGSGNPLSFLNPDDIESIDVLKDADATAIYGSRAANGAILITTKKGKSGRTLVDLNMQNGWGTVARRLNLLNTQQYLQMRHEAQSNDGIMSPGISDFDINGTWDSTRNTDWQKQLIGGTAQYTNLQGSISGGNANTQFLVGGGYHRETTVFPGSLADQKGSLHFMINNTSPDQRFRMQLSGEYLVDNNNLINVDLTGSAMQIAPDAPPLYKADGTLNWAPSSTGNSTWTNPLSYLLNTYDNKTNNLIGNAILSYRILPGLDIRTSLGYTDLVSNESQIYPIAAYPPEDRTLIKPSAAFANAQINSWIVEPQLNYKKFISRGKLDLLIGSTIQQNNSYRQQFTGTNYSTDAQLQDIHSAGMVTVNSTVNAIYKYNAAFARINYNWQDKYIIDLTGRRDGSSRFGPANQFHNFGSGALGWIFSNEPWVKNNLTLVSFGKLRGSYGTTGNDQIGDYTFLNLYNNVTVAVPYQGVNGLVPAGIYNPYLQWEETKKLQGGIDLGFFKDRMLLTVNYVHNRSSNELLSYALPIITGFSSIGTVNFPATIQNTDWEVTLTSSNIKRKDFSWNTSFNLTIPQNKLVSFPGIVQSSYANSYVVGQPFILAKVYQFLGVNSSTGTYQFADWKGGTTSRPDTASNKTRTAIINTAPKFYGGLSNSISYKGFQLDFLFQFVKQIGGSSIFGNYPGRFSGTSNTGNQLAYVLQRWQKPGDNKPIQRYSSTYALNLLYPYVDATGSSGAYLDASYIRLKNVALSWQLPKKWRQSAHLQNARLYVLGQNLITFTSYKGLDPETRSSTSLPPLRVFVFGLDVAL